MRQGGLVLVAILLVACEPSAEHVAGEIATDDRFATRILVLEELRAWELATPDQYAGGFVLNEDVIIVWDSLGVPYALGLEELGPRELPGLDVLSQEAPWQRERGMASSQLLGLGILEFLESVDTSCLSVERTHALVWGSGGVVALTDLGRSGVAQLSHARLDGDRCDIFAGPVWRCPFGMPSLAPSEGFLAVLGCPDPSSPLYGVSLLGDSLVVAPLEGSIPPGLASGAPDPDEPLWIGLPLLPLDDGFFRVFSDLRSDRRRLEVWKPSGGHWRTVHIEVPLGFFESNPHEQLLLGVRGSGLPELVLYEWKWESVENR